MGETIGALLDREHGRRVITLDPNPRPALGIDRGALERWLTRADIVKASQEDLAWLYPGQAPAQVAHAWRAGGAALVVVTRGGDGVFAAGPSGEVELAAQPVDLVDTVGAGDAFMSGLLAALDRAAMLDRDHVRALGVDELAAALRYAQRVAALTCTRVGADPPWLVDLADTPL
jgi:fructokinase